MTGPFPHTKPLSVARESMHMARDSGCKVFETVAMVSMVAMALAALTHAGHILLRDLNQREREQRGHGRGR
jgi:hypothetical protein